MKMELAWSELADQDMTEHITYLAVQSHTSALRFVEAVASSCDLLCSSPLLGSLVDQNLQVRAWTIRGFARYLILFRLQGRELEVLRVMHGASDWHSLFFDAGEME